MSSLFLFVGHDRSSRSRGAWRGSDKFKLNLKWGKRDNWRVTGGWLAGRQDTYFLWWHASVHWKYWNVSFYCRSIIQVSFLYVVLPKQSKNAGAWLFCFRDHGSFDCNCFYLCTSHIWAFLPFIRFNSSIDDRLLEDPSINLLVTRLTWIRLMPLCKSITCLWIQKKIGRDWRRRGIGITILAEMHSV